MLIIIILLLLIIIETSLNEFIQYRERTSVNDTFARKVDLKFQPTYDQVDELFRR